MATKPTAVAVENATTPTSDSLPVTLPTPSTTRWDAFEKAKLNPVSIVCDGALPYHRANLGCHSKTLLNANALLAHLESDHGGGFVFQFKVTDGKSSPIWNDLREKGIEIVDCRCNICGHQVPLHPQHLLKHMKPHTGKLKRNLGNQKFDITLATNAPITPEDEAFESF